MPRPRAIATSRDQERRGGIGWIAAGALLLAGALWAAEVRAEGDLIVSHAFSNFGEVKYGPDFAHLDYVNPDAPRGGEISFSARGNFDNFNPWAFDGVAAANANIGAEGILTSTADDPYGLYCFMCTTMEYDEDLSFVTFNLRDDVTFADGTPMTAEDVAFSFNLFLEQGIAEFRLVRSNWIDQVTIEDPYRITFTFADVAPRRERISFAGATPVFSKAWFEANELRLDEPIDVQIMATGRYVLDDFDFGRFVSYRVNPEYWAADINWMVGRQNFEAIRVEYFADSEAAFQAFTAGEFTYRVENTSLIWATRYDFPALENGWVVRSTPADGTVGRRQAFLFQLDREKWQDQRTRRAMGLMFNFAWTNQELQYGLFSRPTSFWPGTDLGASGLPSEAELELLRPLVDEGLIEASILEEEARLPYPGDASDNTPRRSVRAEALGLLAEAGWVPGSDGVLRRDGEVLSLEIIIFSPTFERVMNPFVANLRSIGVDAKISRFDVSTYQERLLNGDFDLATGGYLGSFEPGTELKQWFGSETAGDRQSSRNLGNLADPAVDRLIPLVEQATTLEELQTATRSLDRVLRHIEFDIPQWFNSEHWVAYYDMYRHPDPIPPLALGTLDFWWYDAERAEELRAAGAFQ